MDDEAILLELMKRFGFTDEDAINLVLAYMTSTERDGSAWYSTESDLSEASKESGRFRRIELWNLTKAAAGRDLSVE